MKHSIAMLVLAFATISFAQEEPAITATATPAPEQVPALTPNPVPPKRSWFGRMLHPFSSKKGAAPINRDPKLRGLTLDLVISPQPVKLSEVRQLEIKLTVTNRSKRAVTLDFANDQRIDIHLINSAEVVLTRWSDNHVIEPKAGVVLINPQEHVEYNQTIATRDLSPNKVFVAHVFFPKYPELRVRQKFLTAP